MVQPSTLTHPTTTTIRQRSEPKEVTLMSINEIMFLGDIHGRMSNIATAMETAALNGIDTIVQVGDFWLYEPGELFKMERVQKRVREQFGVNVEIHFIDGNHEDYRIINPHGKTHELLPGVLTYHPRSDVFKVKGVTFGCFGGAVSIDQQFRKPGKTWWAEEVPSPSDVHRAHSTLDITKIDTPIDVLLTHDIPDFALGQVVDLDKHRDIHDSQIVRQMIDEIAEISHAPLIIHGHWHTYAEESYGGVKVLSLSRDCHHGSMVRVDEKHEVEVLYRN